MWFLQRVPIWHAAALSLQSGRLEAYGFNLDSVVRNWNDFKVWEIETVLEDGYFTGIGSSFTVSLTVYLWFDQITKWLVVVMALMFHDFWWYPVASFEYKHSSVVSTASVLDVWSTASTARTYGEIQMFPRPCEWTVEAPLAQRLQILMTWCEQVEDGPSKYGG